jgi:hypothetical protein
LAHLSLAMNHSYKQGMWTSPASWVAASYLQFLPKNIFLDDVCVSKGCDLGRWFSIIFLTSFDNNIFSASTASTAESRFLNVWKRHWHVVQLFDNRGNLLCWLDTVILCCVTLIMLVRNRVLEVPGAYHEFIVHKQVSSSWKPSQPFWR